MTVDKILEILKMGDKKGSALKQLALYYGCEDYDLSSISNEMADAWITRQRCEDYVPENLGWCGTCLVSDEAESCPCEGDLTKCKRKR